MNTLSATGGIATLFAQNNDGGGMAAMFAMAGTCFAVFGVLFLVGIAIGWKIFTKAGQPGWASIIPFYSQWILITEICKKEPLWFILTLVPIANIVAAWVICMETAKKFGKTETFGIGLFFLGPICWAILAFGDAQYQGGKGVKKRSRDDDDENW